MVEEVALKFEYPYEDIDEAEELEKLLDEKNIKFVFYESNGYWNHEFVVRRSGYTWNEIMKIINSVKPAKYKKVKTWFNDNNEEVVFCSNENRMNIVKLRIYPSIGRGSFDVSVEVPGWVSVLDDFIEEWVEDCLINVDHWKYLDTSIWK